MKKLNFVILAIAICALIISVFLARALLRKDPTITLTERSLTDKALAYFDDNIRELTAAQIAAQQEELSVRQAEAAERKANIQARIALIGFRIVLKKVGLVAALSVSCVSVLLLASAGSVVIVRKGTVFVARVNGSEFPTRYKDLSAIMPALMGSVQAQIQAALATNEEYAQNRAHSILEDMASMVKAVGGRRGIAHQALDVVPQGVPALLPSTHTPTFQQALADFRPSEVVIGYKDNAPVYIPVERLVSAAVGGESNSGKTSKLRFSLAQLIRNGVDVSILDAHQGIEGSLVDSLGTLAGLPNVRIFHPFDTKEAVETMLAEVQAAIDTGTKAIPPRVYVLDELRPLNRACERVELLMDKLANEGRKYGYYGIFSSQTWEASMFAKSGSAARDACVLKMAARMPKDQARILTKDNEAAKLISRLTAPELYVSSLRFDGVVNVPFASLADMNSIAQEYAQKTAVAVHQNLAHMDAPQGQGCEIMQGTYADKGEEEVTPIVTEALPTVTKIQGVSDLAQKLRDFMEGNEVTLSKFAEWSGVNKGLLSAFLRGEKQLSEKMRELVTACIQAGNAQVTPSNIIAFPGGQK